MATGADIRAALGGAGAPLNTPPVEQIVATGAAKSRRRPLNRKYTKPRDLRPVAPWVHEPSTSPRPDGLNFRRWRKNGMRSEASAERFKKYDVKPEVPEYDEETYAQLLTNPDWSKEETDYLINLYRECNGKWPVVYDHYTFAERNMEDLKVRFYTISAAILSKNTPISSMTESVFHLHEMLSKFSPKQETSRKKLAEGHLYRRQNEVDEETVLLNELQRIMLNQANLDSEREDLRRRLDHPVASTNGYQYGTSQALTTLWQQLLAADRLKKNQRLRPTGNPSFDGPPNATSASARPRDSNAGLTDAAGRRNPSARDSLPSTAATPQSGGLPADLSKADLIRFGVNQTTDKLPSGVTFASDKLTKPRIAKSTVQTDKIAAILAHIGVPDLVPLPTPPVVEQFEVIMSKVHALLDLRKVADKEEQELRVRTAEAAAAQAS